MYFIVGYTVVRFCCFYTWAVGDRTRFASYLEFANAARSVAGLKPAPGRLPSQMKQMPACVNQDVHVQADVQERAADGQPMHWPLGQLNVADQLLISLELEDLPALPENVSGTVIVTKEAAIDMSGGLGIDGASVQTNWPSGQGLSWVQDRELTQKILFRGGEHRIATREFASRLRRYTKVDPAAKEAAAPPPKGRSTSTAACFPKAVSEKVVESAFIAYPIGKLEKKDKVDC